MDHFETSEIKRHKDGSINTAHYTAIGRRERAKHARIIAGHMIFRQRKIFTGGKLVFPWTFANLKPADAV